MLEMISKFFAQSDSNLRGRLIGVYALLMGANIAIWVWALAVLRDNPVLIGTALLAYTFGLRHAVDADHIAAIDNVTRKLMQQGQRPVGVGLFFALGHSAVVVLLSLAVAFAASEVQGSFDSMKAFGGFVATLVSASFLFAIALFNIIILISIYRTFQAVKRGEPYVEEDLDLLLNNRGFLARIFRPLFRLVSKSWHMLPIGFLFGLGFDTATEGTLFGISAVQASNGASLATILVFPALFAAGMTLIDTTDGVLMLGAYGWAFMKPMRKLYYNITITAVSVVVAVIVGGLEVLNLVGDQLGLTDGDGFWGAIGAINDNFGVLGYIIIGIFLAAWIGSVAFYKFMRYDELDVKLGASS
jgi:nickel/cobalt transporter (NiCoT) family protein